MWPQKLLTQKVKKWFYPIKLNPVFPDNKFWKQKLIRVFPARCGDPQRVHRGGHVCHQSTQEDRHREGLPGGRQQGHQVLRQVQRHPQIHDLQLSVCMCVDVVRIHSCSNKNKVYSSLTALSHDVK